MTDKSEIRASTKKQSRSLRYVKTIIVLLIFAMLWIMMTIWGVEVNRNIWVKKTQVPITLTNYIGDGSRPAGELWLYVQHNGVNLDSEKLLNESVQNNGWRVQDGCLVSTAAEDSITLLLEAPADLKISLSSFPFAGQLEVSREGYSQVYDIYAEESGQKTVDPLIDMVYETDENRILLMEVLAGIAGILGMVVLAVICIYNEKIIFELCFILPAAYYLVGLIEDETYLTLGQQIMLFGYFAIMGVVFSRLRKCFRKKSAGRANWIASIAVSAAIVFLLGQKLIPASDGMVFNPILFVIGAVIVYAFLISWAIEWYCGRKAQTKVKS